MTDPWNTPSDAPTGPRFADFVGKALLIKPIDYEDGLVGKYTKPGETYDRVVADVVVLDESDPTKSEEHKGLWITQGRVIGKTKTSVGGMVLGKLSRPEPKNAGDNPPYDLDDPDESAIKAARAYLVAGDAPAF